MTDNPKIYAAMSAVMDGVRAVRKGERNAHGGYTFRGIDAVVNAVGPILRREHVVVVPEVRDYEFGEITVGAKQSRMGHARVVVAYTFFAEDGSHISCSAAGEAFDSGDKATPKAMSIAFRTALLQALCLPTDEPDPDSFTYERSESQPQQRAPQPAQQEHLVQTKSDINADKARIWRRARGKSNDEKRAWVGAAFVARGLSADNAADVAKLADELDRME